MNCSIIASLIFLIGAGSLFLSVFFWKKSKKQLFALQWIIILIIVLSCYHTLISGIFQVLCIPINVIFIGVVDLISSIFFWYIIIKYKDIQHYKFELVDLIFIVLLLLGLIYFTKVHYSGMSLRINYASIDAGVHFKNALYTINFQKVDGMFYDMVWNALFIEFLGVFVSPSAFYKLYVLADILNLGLAAAMFYCVIRHKISSSFEKIIGVLLSGIYVITYPLNVTLFGFTYLGMSITIIGIIILLMEFYMKNEISIKFCILLLMLTCFGVFETYVLFVPVLYFAVILCVFFKQSKAKCLFSKDTILTSCAIFLVPCILGLYFVYGSIFTNGVTVANAINNEGGCYRELFSNFIFFIPVAILGYLMIIRKKENVLLEILTPLLVIFSIIIFIMVLKGKASTYYYYKMYYPIWLVIMLLNYEGFLYTKNETKILSCSVWGMWILLFAIFANNIETRLQNKNPNILSEVRSQHYVDIVKFNNTYLFLPAYDEQRIDLYQWVYNCIDLADETCIPGAVRYEDNFWFQDITMQDFSDWDFYNMNFKSFNEKIRKINSKYILVFYDSPVYLENSNYFDSFEKKYVNNIGFIAEIK